MRRLTGLQAVFKREFQGYFSSPLGYIFIVIFLVAIGYLTVSRDFGRFLELRQASLESFFTFVPWLFVVLVPAVAMRLWSEERKSGTVEVLFTLPVTMEASYLGKFLADELNRCGFYAMEVWGGATFDVPHRFLGEDPWERPRTLKKLLPNTKLMMLLRGQNLVGYRNYPDDVVRAFVHEAAEAGIDIFRVFDAVNDERNHETAYKAIKETGKHIQGAICYSLTQPRLGGPVYNIEYFVNKALILQEMGADSICIKDQAGLISPYDAYDLVKALKERLRVPVDLHTHYASGQAGMAHLKAVEAGADIVDTSLAPFAHRTSHPAIEPLVVTLYGTERDTGLDVEQLVKCDRMLEQIAPKYRDFLDTSRLAVSIRRCCPTRSPAA